MKSTFKVLGFSLTTDSPPTRKDKIVFTLLAACIWVTILLWTIKLVLFFNEIVNWIKS